MQERDGVRPAIAPSIRYRIATACRRDPTTSPLCVTEREQLGIAALVPIGTLAAHAAHGDAAVEDEAVRAAMREVGRGVVLGHPPVHARGLVPHLTERGLAAGTGTRPIGDGSVGQRKHQH